MPDLPPNLPVVMMDTQPQLRRTILEVVQKRATGAVGEHDSLALLGIDSIGMAEITFELEKLFKIRFDEDVINIETVDDLVRYVREKQDLAPR